MTELAMGTGPASESVLTARICQTVTHIVLPPTKAAASLRFTFFFAQVMCMIAMGIFIGLHAW